MYKLKYKPIFVFLHGQGVNYSLRKTVLLMCDICFGLNVVNLSLNENKKEKFSVVSIAHRNMQKCMLNLQTFVLTGKFKQ